MISSIDSNVLLDVLLPDPVNAQNSTMALRRCRQEGRLIACDVVWAEVAGQFRSVAVMVTWMERFGIEFTATESAAALSAGETWRAYRQRGGTRQRLIADFLVGAHALHHADRLLTRDRGFYREYFPSLVVIDPTSR